MVGNTCSRSRTIRTAKPIPQALCFSISTCPRAELPFGLQFLYTRENTTTGGEGLYVDAYRVAEDMRTAQPEHFQSLVTDVWEYNNRAKTSDYRGRGPVVETDAAGAITGVRYNTFLRAPMKAPLEVQARALRSLSRLFRARAKLRISNEVPL